MARAQGMPVAGLQLCDRSKFILIETTLPHEGGFGELEKFEHVGIFAEESYMPCCLSYAF
jgi:hypothetical protein